MTFTSSLRSVFLGFAAAFCFAGAAAAQGLPPAVEADRLLQLASSEMAKGEKGDTAAWSKAAAALKGAEATGVRRAAAAGRWEALSETQWRALGELGLSAERLANL